ncbi:hypothetical protein VK792_19235 [Mesobacterium sp. TK19101]|uniref:Uncharacterized protein n=1 Tax=Mesobacterium hydrothermale TaxID=3111907 RepID=A0ABU6HNA0_9RHOB|nr:hypothetical protein [Mesobacterium sp. TK19101]MEC3863424.1 hypothetical protein [Mesobacterium sp. TK19101]
MTVKFSISSTDQQRDEDQQKEMVTSIFHGGQKHLVRMLTRLKPKGEGAPKGPFDRG